ncbi:microviridin/marinostatin family tricyclic proteinase inhibitor [Archangium lansingense]|uniref:Microviridin/marinostatin family tricyclic proteinase inhibitor n=1 Tax=Archangium lansingense TaxID=2995310 RepID=A0ABT4A9V1_9BACT|nr:microviridin/marinostatin family tricyclic proteinase inhibitor [Archangium lansinium]MCY1078421.1 microviridin/marinostatin family tricyclic proteinase inhibitor [Archangium lansinium]
MKKNAKDKVPRKGGKPFFAQLLEAQELEQASGGRPPPPGFPTTKKFPSDNDECDRDPPVTTLKFPSDAEDHPSY